MTLRSVHEKLYEIEKHLVFRFLGRLLFTEATRRLPDVLACRRKSCARCIEGRAPTLEPENRENLISRDFVNDSHSRVSHLLRPGSDNIHWPQTSGILLIPVLRFCRSTQSRPLASKQYPDFTRPPFFPSSSHPRLAV